MDKIYIFDTTLRDGEQVPGAKLNTIEKIEVARQIEKLGVDIIEAGFPISSPEDFKAVEAVAKTIKNSSVCALARGLDIDIESAAKAIEKAVKPRIHTFISASDIHIQNQMKKSREEVLVMVEHAVSKAKGYMEDIEFSPMDASRADIEYLIKFIQVAVNAGATTINFPDTVGYSLPGEIAEMIKAVVNGVPEIKSGKVILSSHMHNDLGLATANSLVAMENGARQIECTINGIGERAGNCALEEVVMGIKTRYGNKYYTDINTKEIIKSSRMVSSIMGLPVQPNKSIVGANAFAHSSGIHQDGLIKFRENFEIMNPEDVGLTESGIILTARSGRSALIHKLNNIGYDVSKETIDPIYKKFLVMADQKKEVYDEDLHILMGANEGVKVSGRYELELVQVLCGNKNVPMATVTIHDNDKDEYIEGVSTGTGPIDAVYKAIDNVISKKIELKEFLVQAITQGIDANGKVSVQIEVDDKSYYGYGTDMDIIVSSTKAYLDAINKTIESRTWYGI